MVISLKCKEVLCYIYSIILSISGLALICLACWMCYGIFYHFAFLPNDTIVPFIIIIIVGVIHLFLTWLAVKGPSTEHDFFIILSIIVITLILIVELAVGIYAIVLWNKIDVKTEMIMQQSLGEHLRNFEHDNKEWARLETKLECCGITGQKDYQNSGKAIPKSCCIPDIITDKCTYYFNLGCKYPLVADTKSLLVNISIVGFVTAAFQALGLGIYIAFYRGLVADRLNRSATRANRLNQLRQSQRNYHQAQPQMPQPQIQIQQPQPNLNISITTDHTRPTAPAM